MKEEKIYYRDGELYYNPHDAESINAALKEVVTQAQIVGFNQGADKLNYKKGIRKGLQIGAVLSIVGSLAVAVLAVVLKKKGK